MLLKACTGFKYFVSLCIAGFLFSKDTNKQLVFLCASACASSTNGLKLWKFIRTAYRYPNPLCRRLHRNSSSASANDKGQTKGSFTARLSVLRNNMKNYFFFSFSKKPTMPSLHTCMSAKIAASTKLVNFSLSIQGYELMGAK